MSRALPLEADPTRAAGNRDCRGKREHSLSSGFSLYQLHNIAICDGCGLKHFRRQSPHMLLTVEIGNEGKIHFICFWHMQGYKLHTVKNVRSCTGSKASSGGRVNKACGTSRPERERQSFLSFLPFYLYKFQLRNI